MKISAYHKSKGDTVEMYLPIMAALYDKIYASKIFKSSDGSNLMPESMEIGGTGWDMQKSLPAEIEAMQPDYSLYNYPHSIGFTMRGCRFNCSFCVVPEKEGKPSQGNSIDEIWTNRDSDFIMLLDNDFFGHPLWEKRIEEIRNNNLRVNFSQGLNIRIITDAQAKALRSVRFFNKNLTSRQVCFAWDRVKDETLIMQGINKCIMAGIKPREMMFYILSGYDSTIEEDHYRVMKIAKLGADPFVMIHENGKDYLHERFARWVNNKAVFNSTTWENYG